MGSVGPEPGPGARYPARREEFGMLRCRSNSRLAWRTSKIMQIAASLAKAFLEKHLLSFFVKLSTRGVGTAPRSPEFGAVRF